MSTRKLRLMWCDKRWNVFFTYSVGKTNTDILNCSITSEWGYIVLSRMYINECHRGIELTRIRVGKFRCRKL